MTEIFIADDGITETRVVNPVTGGEKGAKPEKYSQFPWEYVAELARVYEFGSRKYAAHNYRKGYDWSLSFDALIRHAVAFWSGEDIDPESGLPHLAHAAWHCFALMSFAKEHPELDDRFKPTDETEHTRSAIAHPLPEGTKVHYRIPPTSGKTLGIIADVEPGGYDGKHAYILDDGGIILFDEVMEILS